MAKWKVFTENLILYSHMSDTRKILQFSFFELEGILFFFGTCVGVWKRVGPMRMICAGNRQSIGWKKWHTCIPIPLPRVEGHEQIFRGWRIFRLIKIWEAYFFFSIKTRTGSWPHSFFKTDTLSFKMFCSSHFQIVWHFSSVMLFNDCQVGRDSPSSQWPKTIRSYGKVFINICVD